MPSFASFPQPLALSAMPSLAVGQSLTDTGQAMSTAPQASPVSYMMLSPMPAQADVAAGKVTVIQVREIIRYLREHWRMGFSVAAVVAALVFLYLGFGAKVYETESKLEVRIQETSLLKLGEPGGGLTEQSSLAIVNNHRTNLRTRRFVDHVFSLIPSEEMAAYIAGTDQVGWKRKLLVKLGLGEMPPPLSPQERFAAKIDQALRVEPVKDSHILRIIVQDGDPDTASSIANHYARSYLDYVENDLAVTATTAQERLAAKVREAKAKLDAIELELAAFSEKADILKSGDTADMSTLSAEKFARADSDLEVEMLGAQQRVRQLRNLLAQGANIAGIRGVGDDLQIIEIQKQLIAAKTRQATLQETCGPRHPRLVQTANEIARLEQDNKARIENLVQGAESEVQRLTDEKLQLSKMLVNARLRAFGQNPNRTRLKQLADEVESQRLLYTDLSKHQENARLTAELGGNSHIDVIDSASVSDDPVKPRKSLALIASVILFGLVGFGLPVGIGLAQDHVAPLFRPLPAAVPRAEMPPPAAHPIPSAPVGLPSPFQALQNPFAAMPLPQHSSSFEDIRVLARLPPLNAQSGPTQLSEVLHDPRLFGDRAFIQIVSLVEELHGARHGPITLLITSANNGEGKSLFAAALSASLCTIGRSVLLIDCNTTSPGLPHYFPQADGFSALASEMEAIRYGQTSMFLLPTTDLPSNDMLELIGGYRAWIERARANKTDWIILDAASLLHGFADLAQLATLATDTILLQDATRSDARQVKAALNLLRPIINPDSMRGVILNRLV